MPELGWVLAAIALVGVVVLGVLLRRASTRSAEDRASWEKRSRADIASARESAQAAAVALRADAERVLAQAEARAKEEMEDVERRRREMEASISSQRAELREERAAQERRAERLHEREDRVAADAEGLAAKAQRLEVQRTQQRETRDELREERESVALELERVASLTVADAKREIIAEAERQAKLTATQLARTIETTAKRDADRTARGIVVTAIQRVAAEQTSESVVSTVHLPSDEMKGRIIGREGRNIRALETATGVDLIIDDTPEAITLSSFDQTRREVARMTLERLIGDGRIHPARIEETVEKCRHDLELQMKREGERAVMELGIHGLHPDLIKLIGRLKYRTSFGQNALTHSMEVAWLAGLLAGEMGVNVTLARRAGLLHDIGKALDHEIEGSHVQIGVDICRKYKENTQVIHAIEAHHGDVEPKTPLAFIIQACDAISAARPGARRENVESYVKRLENLEEISSSFEGVEQAFAVQAGREVRIMVKPDVISDDQVILLARQIAKKIEDTLDYPGQIKVNVIRESRAVDYAK